jgi:alkylation response protein AidB-like acyl-CoA dehydrogenase
MAQMHLKPADDAASPIGGAELQKRVLAVLPQIAANAERAEEERRVPPENVAILRETGLFRAFQPRIYGGLELRIEEYAPCLVMLAGACGSTAWVSSLLAQHVHGVALFSREAQDEIWGSDGGEALIASSVAPIGKAELAEGGVTLSGKFGFSSGSDHAQWYILGFRHPGHQPPQDRHFAIVPREQVTIVDDWHTAGMRGTGSKTLIVDKAFVPDRRIESLFALNNGKSKGFGANESPIYHAAFMNHFNVGFPSVAIGMARRMAEVYAEKTRSRIKIFTGQNATTRSPAAIRLARGAFSADAASAMMEKIWRGIDVRCASRQMPTVDEMFRWRTQHSYVIQLAIQAADELFGGSGGSAWFNSNEMQRLWRNTHMCGAHAGTDYDTCSEVYGRYLLGLDLDPSL